MATVLVVDDDRRTRRVLQILLEQMGLQSVAAENGEHALTLFETDRFDCVLTDLRMPGVDGLELLRRLRVMEPALPIIVFTAHGTIPTAVTAMKEGAYDYIQKPFDVAVVEPLIRNAIEMRRQRVHNRFLRDQLDVPLSPDIFVGRSSAMRAVDEMVHQVAPTKMTILLTGETGTGKEVVARTLHKRSPRAEQLFVPLNCAAIPADLLETELFGHVRGAFTGAHIERVGKFELADGGTLYLDEIGDMAYPLQAKLLRVLQEGVIERIGSNKPTAVDVRIIASTNRDLAAAIRDGRFREDLYFRLNVFHIHLPPLRERLDDLEPLATGFLDQFGAQLGKGRLRVSAEGFALLRQYRWPGNVRELRNLMERAAVLCRGAEVDAALVRSLLPELSAVEAEATAGESFELEPALRVCERHVILRALAATHDNKAEAARLLGVSERTLWYKLRRHGL